jgi:hypothetical protein
VELEVVLLVVELLVELDDVVDEDELTDDEVVLSAGLLLVELELPLVVEVELLDTKERSSATAPIITMTITMTDTRIRWIALFSFILMLEKQN